MSQSNKQPKQLPVGTKVRFIKELGADATGDHPALFYAEVGDRGVVTGHDCKEGHWIRVDNWLSAFGAVLGGEFVEDQP